MICVYVRIIWRQGRHCWCRDVNRKPLNVFLTPRRCSVLYFVNSVIYQRTCRYHGCAQLKSLINYQTTRYNHLPWGRAVCTNDYLSRISGRIRGDHKRWTLRHYMCRSLFYMCTMAGRHTSMCVYIYITGVPRGLDICDGRAVTYCCETWRASRQMEESSSAASRLALDFPKEPPLTKILWIL
jgi:hypothetical protein